ncbi:MAG: bifunctional UDP-N-acetylmuramoyl-tripeptide:D-alanyl-D-alanine ligase/alanine racemase, partial [Bacteroidota bacterium]
HHDGHTFLADLYEQGVRSFVIEKDLTDLFKHPQDFKEANFIEVKNSISALQQLAASHRQQYAYPVVGITGSNGKTIVKEWLYQLLEEDYPIVRSPKSYNSQIGVPLSVWQMNDTHTLALIEAGISQPNEMAKLVQVIQPTIGILTNIGTAHDEGFVSREEKVKEKLQLFEYSEVVICQQATLDRYRPLFGKLPLFSWGEANSNTLQIKASLVQSGQTIVQGSYQQKAFQLSIPFTDTASVENSLHGVALMCYLGYDWASIQARLDKLRTVSMRLELKQGIQQSYLIDDTYNNDLAGLKIALDFLQNQQQRSKKTLILSDLLETGQSPQALYTQISQWLLEKGVERFIGVGPTLMAYQSLFAPMTNHFFPSTQALLEALPQLFFRDELVLIKGARTFQFEQVVEKLQYKAHRTVLEINLDALVHNLNYYRNLLKPTTKIMVMVKAFAYGSGASEVANVLQFHRVDHLAVAYTDEGVQLRQNGITLPIMVMNVQEDAFYQLVTHQLAPQVYSFRLLDSLERFLATQAPQATLSIHIKLDTGMHRLGFEEADLPLLVQRLQHSAHFKVVSILSHLAGADEDRHQSFSHQQMERFTQWSTYIERSLKINTLKHLLNSPGIVRFPTAQFDMVRLGVGLYGVEANRKQQKQLRTVGRLKTTISQIKTVKAGETVGYGRWGKVEKNTRVATIAIGYADGFSRAFSRGIGKVKIRGQLKPILGNVCMDMCMVDIGDLPAKEGDEVIIFDEEWSIWQMAAAINTIPYEILTSISERVKRVYYTE